MKPNIRALTKTRGIPEPAEGILPGPPLPEDATLRTRLAYAFIDWKEAEGKVIE